MAGVARQDDLCGGTITSIVPTVKVNKRAIATVNAVVQSHSGSPHSSTTLTSLLTLPASTTVRAGGRFVSRLGDPAVCGHLITTASGNVNAG